MPQCCSTLQTRLLGNDGTIPFFTNCDTCLNPVSNSAYPQLLTGEAFVADQSYPTVSGDKECLTFTYGSNPSDLQKGCMLNYVPLMYVVEDWSNPSASIKPYYVDDGNGSSLYRTFVLLQSPVVITADYSSYTAHAVTSLTSPEVAGYNRLQALSDYVSKEVEANSVRIYSNVKWFKSDVSLENTEIPFFIKNDYISVATNGKKIVATDMDLFIRNTLTYVMTINGDRLYRPQEAHKSRWTYLDVDADLLNGVHYKQRVAQVGQPGVPHASLPSGSGNGCWEGSYSYDGDTYKYCVSFNVSVEVDEMDELTSFFCDQPEIMASSSGGKVKDYHRWNRFPMWSGTYSGTLYCNGDCSMTFDWRVPMANGVYIYSDGQGTVNWTEHSVPVYNTPRHKSPAPLKADDSAKEIIYKGKPSLAPKIPSVSFKGSGRCDTKETINKERAAFLRFCD